MSYKRAILINPIDRKVTEVQVPDSDTLKEWYRLMDCDCVDQAYRFPNGDCVLLDDEGLFKGEANSLSWFALNEIAPQPLAGKALIIGAADRHGNTTNAKTTLRELERFLFWLSPEAAKYAFEKYMQQPLTRPKGYDFVLDGRMNPFTEGGHS